MSDYTHVYFVGIPVIYKGRKCMKIKYGDSRGDTDIKSEYFREIPIHENSSGKEIENIKLRNMVKYGLAEKVNGAEEYVVRMEVGESLWHNWEINTLGDFISADGINNVLQQSFWTQ